MQCTSSNRNSFSFRVHTLQKRCTGGRIQCRQKNGTNGRCKLSCFQCTACTISDVSQEGRKLTDVKTTNAIALDGIVCGSAPLTHSLVFGCLPTCMKKTRSAPQCVVAIVLLATNFKPQFGDAAPTIELLCPPLLRPRGNPTSLFPRVSIHVSILVLLLFNNREL